MAVPLSDSSWPVSQTRLLRSVLEWGREIETEEGASDVEELTSDVTVVMWPPGDLKQLPRGTTAGAVIKIYVRGLPPPVN